jgi:peptidyl-dipeptidase A
LFAHLGCLDEKQQAEKILSNYISKKVDLIRNYSMESSTALWNATVSGSENDYRKFINIELEFNKSNQNSSKLFEPDRFISITQNVFTNEQDFQMLKTLKFSGLITDTLLNRQLNVLYQAFMGSQIEAEKYKELMMNEIKLWQAFSVLKITIDGKKYGSRQVDSIRRYTIDASLLKVISDSLQHEGKALAPDIIKMVKDRNDFANHFGYSDFYRMTLESKDQTPEEVADMLHKIEVKTHDQYFEAKRVVDNLLAKRFKIKPGELQHWFYNDEQTSYLPEKFKLQMDSLFADIDPIKKTAQFFSGIGMPIQDVIDNSDLKASPKKPNINAMINVDFKNDIRLIGNIQPTYDGMGQMLHLGGHASQYKSISDNVPYLLKTPNYMLSEGVARYFESLASDINWLKSEVSIDDKKQKQLILVCQHLHQVDRLFRCRRLLVMADFEREIYRDPVQNLDSLWADLNARYLGFQFPERKNECYWAANRFATSLSCTNQNLVLADVFAAQLQHYIETTVIKKANGVYAGNKDVGAYLYENIYRYGNLLPWQEIIEKATGEQLNTAYFVDYLIDDEVDTEN